MRKALSFPEVELCLFPVFDIEIDSDPIQQSSHRSRARFRAAEKPAIPPSALRTRKLTWPAQPVRRQVDQTLRVSS